jgi:hypothetical protein
MISVLLDVVYVISVLTKLSFAKFQFSSSNEWLDCMMTAASIECSIAVRLIVRREDCRLPIDPVSLLSFTVEIAVDDGDLHMTVLA